MWPASCVALGPRPPPGYSWPGFLSRAEAEAEAGLCTMCASRRTHGGGDSGPRSAMTGPRSVNKRVGRRLGAARRRVAVSAGRGGLVEIYCGVDVFLNFLLFIFLNLGQNSDL